MTQPTDSGGPTEPTRASEPTEPMRPGEPIEPIRPGEPTEPTEAGHADDATPPAETTEPTAEASPLLTVTAAARAKLGRAAASSGHADARLRVGVTGRAGARYTYDLRLVPPEAAPADDVLVDAGDDLIVHVAADSADALRGATVDLDESTFGGAIVILNPNEGWSDPLAERVQLVLDRVVNPGIASHGGRIDLLEVRDGTAYIEMGGGCQGCAQVDVTLRQGVEVAIRQAVPEIVAIVDTTDHAAGTNPYFQPAKK